MTFFICYDKSDFVKMKVYLAGWIREFMSRIWSSWPISYWTLFLYDLPNVGPAHHKPPLRRDLAQSPSILGTSSGLEVWSPRHASQLWWLLWYPILELWTIGILLPIRLFSIAHLSLGRHWPHHPRLEVAPIQWDPSLNLWTIFGSRCAIEQVPYKPESYLWTFLANWRWFPSLIRQ